MTHDMIASWAFLDSLGDLIPENARRVVIDAQMGHALMIYIEQVGDARWLDVQLPDGKVNIITAPEGLEDD